MRAAEVVALFCYQAKKWIGSFAAALVGLDTLVFAGRIGENTPLVRTRICEGLRFLGIELQESRNAKATGMISTDASQAIYEEDGKTMLATLKPTTLLAMFNAPQLEGVAQEVEATILKIMEEAAAG